tara:strand:- start:49 stop:465 length:417 start_codon:yes stop_codon:yes gene_type:complete
LSNCASEENQSGENAARRRSDLIIDLKAFRDSTTEALIIFKEDNVSVYRITRFAASDMDKAGEIAESLRNEIENLGADFIDMVSYGNGKGVVIAKYPDQATMDAASQTAKQAFSKMIDAGVVDGDSVHPHMGEVFKSF